MSLIEAALPAARRLVTAWAVLATSLVLSLAIGLGAHLAIDDRIEARFEGWVEDSTGRLQARLAAQVALVQGTAALLTSGPGRIADASFRTYVDRLHLEDRFPGLRALGHVVHRPDAIAGDRGDVVVQLEPSRAAGDPSAWLGVDFAAHPIHRAALVDARDRGEPVLSAPFRLGGAGRDGVGLLLVQPLYLTTAPSTVAARRAALVGYVVAPIAAEPFFAGAFAADLDVPVALEVHDGERGGGLLYRDPGRQPVDAAAADRSTSRAIDGGGRRWTLVAAARPGLVPLRERLVAPALTAFGVALSFLLFGLTRSQARARATAENTVEAMRRGEGVRAALLETERAARREAQRLIVALERSNRDLDQFAYVASHDLKSPLRGIANLATWIEEDVAATAAPETRRHLDLLRGRVHRLEALIDGILSYARAGRADDPAEQVDVGALVNEVVGLLAPPPTASISIGPLPTLRSPKVPLEQVFMNYVANALKYAARPSVRIRIEGERRGRGWSFSVSDDGPGIAPEYHERVWQMFQTLQTRDQVEATGIGLAVVKKIVEARGGEVGLRSDPGAGTTFWFSWPDEDERADGGPLRPEPRPLPAPRPRPPRRPVAPRRALLS